MNSELEPCFACGGRFASCEGPVHRYMLSSPGCWASYTAVLAREYSDPEYFAVHRHTVDTFAVQHPGGHDAQSVQSIATHLTRLCLLLEKGQSGRRADELMMQARQSAAPFVWLEPPSRDRYTLTVANLMDTTDAADHQERVVRWARSAWAAWEPHHTTVRSWIEI